MRRTNRGWIVALALLAAAQARAADSTSRETSPSVIVEQSFELRAKGSPAMDVRWSGRDSIYLLQYLDGVTEVRLAPGLPPLRNALPGPRRLRHVQGQTSLAISGDAIASASTGGHFVWAKRQGSAVGTDARVRRLDASVSDFDFDGDRILLLGDALVGDGTGGTFLWTGALDSAAELESAPGLEKAQGTAEVSLRAMYMALHAGSIRVLPNSDRLVVSGFEPEARLISAGGKVKARWDLATLGVASRETLDGIFGADMRRFRGKATPFVREWAAAGSIVDDAFLVGKTPALIVRQRRDDGPHWLLVLLEDRPRAFAIPVAGATDDTRLCADGDPQGRIVLLAGRRESTPDDLGPQEVLVVSLP